jgi:hypothetical protein
MFTVKNDWVLQVQTDLKECGIDLTESEISKMKRISFEKLVCEKINRCEDKFQKKVQQQS